MSRKKINIILIVAVLFIWSVVLYKFVTPFFTEMGPVLTTENLIVQSKKVIRKKDTVNLSFPERDPFLGKVKVKKKLVSNSTPSVKSRSANTLKPVQWPKIEYLGFIKSNKSKGRLGLLRVDGVLHRVYKNTNVNNLKIIVIGDAEVLVKIGSEEKKIKKQ